MKSRDMGIAKFIRNLTLKKRLLLLVVVPSFLLFLIVAEKVISGLNEIDRINSKLNGLNYVKIYTDTVLLMQRHRGLMFLYLNGRKEKEVRKRIERLEPRIDDYLLKAMQHCKYEDKEDKTEERELKVVKAAFEKLKIGTNTYQPLDSFKKHTELIGRLLSLMNREGKKRRILTDSNLNVRILADISLFEIPNLAETAGRIRGFGSGILAKGNITETEKRKMLSLYNTLRGYQYIINWSIENVKLPTKVLKELQKSEKRINEFQRIVENNFLIGDRTSSLPPVDYFNKSTLVVNEVFNADNALFLYLKELLNERESLFVKSLLLNTLALISLSGLIVYLFISIYRITITSINSLLFAAEKILKGDLSITVRQETNDEIGLIAQTLNTAVQKLRETINRLKDYQSTIDSSEIIFKTNSNGLITYVNKNFEKLFGYSADDVLGKPITWLYKVVNNRETLKEMISSMERRKFWKGRLVGSIGDGRRFIVNTTLAPVLKGNNSVSEFVIIFHDITELEENRQKLKYLLNYDSLTGLPNRAKLLHDIQTMHKPALCVLDISNFRYLNELYGEKCGDSILKQVAENLKHIHTNIVPYRVQADEFALLCDLEKGEIRLKEFSDYCSKTVKYLEDKTFKCNDFNIFLNFIAGISVDEKDKKKLLLHADMLLKKAKLAGKKVIIQKKNKFDEENYLKNMLQIRKIKHAIEENRIIPFYQPIVNNKTGNVEKFEALVRLMSKGGKVMSPNKLLSIAKKAILYPSITEIMVKKTLRDFEKLPFGVSINLAYEDVTSGKTVRFILDKVNNFVEPTRLTFEILETEEIESYPLIYRFISMIKERGCRFAVDDFGTGYSNLEHLLKLKVDYLKIDGSIVKRLPTDKGARILVDAVVSFSKEAGIKTVAEFVSNQNIYKAVKEVGVDYSQGDYFGKPEPIELIRKKFQSKRSW